MKIRLHLAIVLALAGVATTPLPAQAGVEYPDADWTTASIPSSDGVTLHAEVLRPKGATEKTPVILSIGPYFNRSGQVGPAGPTQGGAAYDPVSKAPGPSERFKDFIDGSGLLKKGYSFVMVDLRGFGASSGCLDWGGPGETADVKASVEWAASQPWSTGAVGMYGKSYDAVTGLVGANLRPKGLKAVVAQEPVYDLYRYLYTDGIRRLNSAATPALYDAIALTPGGLGEDPMYNAGGATTPNCLAVNFATQAADDDHGSAFWKARNLIPGAKGSEVPLFVTQGMTENNTVADGLAQYLENHTGPERGWLGPWEHVRGDEKCHEDDISTGCTASNIGRLKMGRKGWNEEAMRFYDRYLKGVEPAVEDPPFAIQDNTGTWRGEQAWPPSDTSLFTTPLRAGTYEDSGDSRGTSGELFADEDTTSTGVWTISNPLPHDARLIGSGKASITVQTSAPRANLFVDVYDFNKDGVGPLITRQGSMVRGTGEQKLDLDLWSADWKIPAGHRIAVRVTETNFGWNLLTVGTKQTVTVKGGSVSLPFARYKRTSATHGDPGVQLNAYLSSVAAITGEALAAATTPFALPPAMIDLPRSDAGAPQAPAADVAKTVASVRAATARVAAKRLTLRLKRSGRRAFVASGKAPAGASLVVRLVRSGRTVATKRVKVGRKGTYRVTLKAKRPGRYTVRVTGTLRGAKLKLATAAARLR